MSAPETWEARKPALFFECTHAVYQKGGDSSLCYTTSRERADWISAQLTELTRLRAANAELAKDKERLDLFEYYGCVKFDRVIAIPENPVKSRMMTIGPKITPGNHIFRGNTYRECLDAALTAHEAAKGGARRIGTDLRGPDQ